MKTADMQVTYVDHMGTDLTVVNAARVSFDKESSWEINSPVPRECALKTSDAKLINYLAYNSHWSPFAHTSVQLRVKAPIFVARQLVKHQVGGVWNEVSRRYVDSEPEFYFPDEWRGKPVNAKQGSDGLVDDQEGLTAFVKAQTTQAVMVYNSMLRDGVAPEQARMVLPQNMMTEWYWTGSLVFWARVCRLRLDSHSQAETTQVAQRISDVVAPLFPVSWRELMR
jgi:thymidylate synthase (FAD)